MKQKILEQRHKEYIKKICDENNLGLWHYHEIKRHITTLLNNCGIILNKSRQASKSLYKKIIMKFFEDHKLDIYLF